MADTTKIEWTDATWNPITGCSVVSPGCTNCYAMRLAGTRMKHHPSRAGLTQESKAGPVWTGEVRLNEEWLTEPLRWKRPRRIFVCAHGDLFHENVLDEWIDRVFAVMGATEQHTFQVLTKRPERMRDYMDDRGYAAWNSRRLGPNKWPADNVWLGVSVEDQSRADERIPHLLATKAAVRFVSAEPLLGPVRLDRIPLPRAIELVPSTCNALTGLHWPNFTGVSYNDSLARIDWVIVGGESGPGSRPMHPDWVRSLRDQCRAARTAFFFKQWGDWLVGETRNGLPIPFQDGNEFDVVSDGHDIILSAAYDEPGGPTHLWREYYGWHHHLVRRLGKGRAGRLLDGRTWDQIPEGTP